MKKMMMFAAFVVAMATFTTVNAQDTKDKKCTKTEKCEKKCTKAECKSAECKKADCKDCKCGKGECKKADKKECCKDKKK